MALCRLPLGSSRPSVIDFSSFLGRQMNRSQWPTQEVSCLHVQQNRTHRAGLPIDSLQMLDLAKSLKARAPFPVQQAPLSTAPTLGCFGDVGFVLTCPGSTGVLVNRKKKA